MQLTKPVFIGIFLLISYFHVSYAWWDFGHMVAVEVAKSQLSPTVEEKVQTIIDYFGEDFPQCSSISEAACFPDDITNLGLTGFKVWHGVLRPYDPEQILSQREKGIIQSLVSTNNLHSAIHQSLKTLKNPRASKWEQAFMLCFLLHCVSDIHQPLHCIQLYSNRFPLGDMAGHRYHLRGSKFKNLHTLWDSMLGLGDERLERPLNAEDKDKLKTFAKDIIDCYPPETFPHCSAMDTATWSLESYNIAISSVYDGIAPDTIPSEDYIRRGREIAKRQIALAGYRLAIVLNELYQEASEE